MTQAGWDNWVRMADQEVSRTLGSLPRQLRVEASAVPVLFQRRPSRAMERDGVDHDTMGLFVGVPFAEEMRSGEDIPAQVILFLEVILDEVNGDEAVFRREVRQTYLHELGHFLGLDESGLEERDLG